MVMNKSNGINVTVTDDDNLEKIDNAEKERKKRGKK